MPLKEKPKIMLEEFEDLLNFTTEEEEKKKDYRQMELSMLQSFPNHKFKLYEGQQLEDMVSSVKALGIIMPLIVWENEDDYIILSGHNRKNAAQLAGLTHAPVIIKKDISKEEAVLYVTETNLRQRSFTDLSHSERAYCLMEHYEAMKKQGKRSDLIVEIKNLLEADEMGVNSTSAEVQQKLESRDKLGNDYGLSRDKVAKYIRIATLEEILMELLDEGSIAFLTAYTLSFVKEKEHQVCIGEFVKSGSHKLDMKKAELLRSYSEKGKLNPSTIEEIMVGEKTRKPKTDKPKKVILKETMIKKHFKNGESEKEMGEIIDRALEQYFKTQ